MKKSDNAIKSVTEVTFKRSDNGPPVQRGYRMIIVGYPKLSPCNMARAISSMQWSDILYKYETHKYPTKLDRR